ncbi:MAG TPA: thiol reductant ABC exporter subunit CydC [Anaerolineaceae bacterium]|nr:thiol reductant ABC exporter subunit CydC [Anaerolineaceae bacterium]
MIRKSVLLRLLTFLKPFAGEVCLSVLSGLATVAAGVGLIATSAYLISAAALRPSVADLQVAIVGVRFFGLSRAVFRYLERLVSHSVNFRLLTRLRVWFYERIEPIAPAGLQDYRGGDLLARAIGDIETLEAFYVRAVAPPIVALLGVLAAWLFFGRYALSAASLLASGMLFVAVALPLLSHRLSLAPSRQLVESRAALNAALVDGVQGLPDLLVFGAAGSHAQRLRDLDAACRSAQRRMSWIAGLNAAAFTLAAHLTAWGVLVIVIPLGSSGQMEGVFLAMLYLGAIASFEAVQPLPQAAQYLETSLQSARRLFEVGKPPHSTEAVQSSEKYSSNPAVFIDWLCEDEGLSPLRSGLSIHDLSFRYHSDLPIAIDHLNLDLPPGKRIAIVGPSGSGKSTLIQILLRYRDFDQGQIAWNGQDIRQISPGELRCQFGLVTANPYLFNTSLEENLRLGCPQATADQIQAALAAAQLQNWVCELPEGLYTRVGERGLRLSQGQRQRVALARALLRDPALLLLDEPTAALDPLTAQTVLCNILDLSMRKSLLLITHHLTTLAAMDEIIVLSQGKVIERGTFAELIQPGSSFTLMLAAQKNTMTISYPDR